jgi:hypothetical protein
MFDVRSSMFDVRCSMFDVRLPELSLATARDVRLPELSLATARDVRSFPALIAKRAPSCQSTRQDIRSLNGYSFLPG